jgi:hypothetical protein
VSWWAGELVEQWDSETVGDKAVGCPLSASRLLPVILSDSEGSRCLPLVTLMLINIGRREDGKTVRRQMADSKRVQAPPAPGFKAPPGLRPGCLRFRPQSGLVQREL